MKLILQNNTDLPMDVFLDKVKEVIALGRLSNHGKQYCFAVSFEKDGKDYYIYSDLNERSDKFRLEEA